MLTDVVEPRPKKDSATRACLEKMYAALDGGSGGPDEGAGMLEGRKEYFPYVSETVSTFKDE